MQNTSGYREAPALCPSCAVMMSEKNLYDAVVEVCSDCDGVWVDWFDGDLTHVIEQVSENDPASARLRADVKSGSPCPKCRAGMTSEFKPGNVHLLRCGDCGGAFVPRASFVPLIAWSHREPEIPAQKSSSVFVRLVAVLNSLLSGKN